MCLLELRLFLFLYSCKPAIIYINISRAQIKRTKNAFTLILSISHIYSELLEDGTGIFEVIQEELSILTAYGVFRVTSAQTMTRRDFFLQASHSSRRKNSGLNTSFKLPEPQLKTLRAKL